MDNKEFSIRSLKDLLRSHETSVEQQIGQLEISFDDSAGYVMRNIPARCISLVTQETGSISVEFAPEAVQGKVELFMDIVTEPSDITQRDVVYQFRKRWRELLQNKIHRICAITISPQMRQRQAHKIGRAHV